MSDEVVIDFPEKTRGTFRVKGDENNTQTDILTRLMAHIEEIAEQSNVTLLVDSKLSGLTWLVRWWPANEPRHEANDQIIHPHTRAIKRSFNGV